MLQPVSWVAAAIGVCIAAVYYVLNLRETGRNRRVQLTNTLMQSVLTEEGAKKFISLMNMEWKDFDDFVKRYDSNINEDKFAKRVARAKPLPIS